MIGPVAACRQREGLSITQGGCIVCARGATAFFIAPVAIGVFEGDMHLHSRIMRVFCFDIDTHDLLLSLVIGIDHRRRMHPVR